MSDLGELASKDLTIRDYFAIKAAGHSMFCLHGLTKEEMDGVAAGCYRFADAMIRERYK